jgi:hypothetical protein
MNTKEILVLTFLITAIWDMTLRIYALTPDSKIPWKKQDFATALIPYFEMHSALKAAVFAGLVGVATQALILMIVDFPVNLAQVPFFLLVAFLVSGVIGFPIEKYKMVPGLTETYYKTLGRPRSFFADGYSGLVVELSLLGLNML